jgi:hypothetical protein
VFVDPAVSKAKFDREVGGLRAAGRAYQAKGIWLLEATYPEVFIAFVAKHTQPAPYVMFGALIDFRDYDVRPLSVHLVNPFTRERLRASEIPYKLLRTNPNGSVQPLVQAFADDRVFLCIQGVREYHENSAHSGDSWFLHRNTGTGALAYIVDLLWKYGAEPIRGPGTNIQIQFAGFAIGGPPPS